MKRRNGSLRRMARGGQNSVTKPPPSVERMRGTPMRSSGAIWVPRRVTQGRSRNSAASRTSALLPMPGGPQMKGVRSGGSVTRSSTSSGGVSASMAGL